MLLTLPSTAFTLYHWSNPHTTAVYPFLALATDRSALLSFGDQDIGFDLRLSAEAAHWLAHDFERTGEGLILELSTVRYHQTPLPPKQGALKTAHFGEDKRRPPIVGLACSV